VSAFLAEAGAKLADRWLQILLLPGLLWTGTLTAALQLGQTHAFAVGRVTTWIDALALRPAAHAPGTVVLAAAGILLSCTGVGLLASGLGGLVERMWALPGDMPPASWLVRARRWRWDAATARLKNAIRTAAQDAGADPARAAARVRSCQRRRDRLGSARPSRPTRIAERFERTAARTAAVNGLEDLDTLWPRLWSVLPGEGELRADIAIARAAYGAAARLAAWGVLYGALTVIWWPAALIGSAVLIIAGVRGRAMADVLASLVETAADLHLPDLAERLGTRSPAEARDLGRTITARLHAGEGMDQPKASKSS
jgi:hypothetical protein